MSILIAATRIIVPKQVFEIGTFLGNTTMNLALNCPDDSVVFTLDLGEQDIREVNQVAADAPLTRIHLASKSSLDYIGSPVEGKITALTGDSTKFDYSPWYDSVDLVFIDGGHDFATVKSDTENAFRMIRKDGGSCVLWHDYLNRDYSGLTFYLDELSNDKQIVHIEDTMLCAWFSEAESAGVTKRLTAV